MPTDTARPDPQTLLRQAAQEERGRLKIFLGAAPGVGKTYAMLQSAQERRAAGVDVVVGIVETHGRPDTDALVRALERQGIETLPRQTLPHQGRPLLEMDLDAILARRPQLVLVDELAHSNVPGCRHLKRYQDVEELLAAGIDVFSTLNIQHVESLNDVVAQFTRVRVRETVPDSVLETADALEVIDIPPDELIERLRQGKVYVPDEASRALTSFFSKANLTALRELALRRAAQAVDAQMRDEGGSAGERVLVVVSAHPGSPEIVRAAKRLADALNARWDAVTLETPRSASLPPAERDLCAQTLRLAAQLGATTATLPATDLATGISLHARAIHATQVVLGEPPRPWWQRSLLPQLTRRLDDVALHVIPLRAAAARARIWPKAGKSLHYLFAALLVGGVTLLGMGLREAFALNTLALLFLVPVMAIAGRYGHGPGLGAGIFSALAYNFFFLPPLYTFTVTDPENIVTLLILLAVATLTSHLTAQVRVQADLAANRARQNATLAGFARTLTGLSSDQEVAHTVAATLAPLFAVRVRVLMPEKGRLILRAAEPAAEEALGMMETTAAQWAFDKNEEAGRGSATLAGSDWLFLPLGSPHPRAVLGVARDDTQPPVPPDQRALLLTLLDQAALALERIDWVNDMAALTQLKERDRLRTALLSAVGHDLRTPLTAILGGIEALRHQPVTPDHLDALEADAQRLHRFVINVLDMARIETGAITLHTEAIDLTDAIASAVHAMRCSLEGHPIALDVPPDLPLVRVDPQLFHHCLINLLDNAGKYATPHTPITLRGRRQHNGVTLCVLDHGPGLPTEGEAGFFNLFQHMAGSDRHKSGTGLGLAIVKGFSDAMGLDLAARNRSDHSGACFTLTLPEALLVRMPRHGADT